VVVTHGPGPVRWFGAGRCGEIPVPAVRAVDTAGAGDAFHGALAVALADIPAPTHPAHPLPAGHPAAVPLPGPFHHDIADLTAAIAFAVRVAGVRVAHRGPRAWLSALTSRPPRRD
jgi:sugar/nucleoside kinase (ribokinase family)